MKRELRDKGYTVLPNRPLSSLNASDLQTVVREELRRSKLSVHLIGNDYGEIPEGGEHSMVDIQLKVAGEPGSNEISRSRLIWLPPGLKAAERRQQEFLDRLRTTVAGQNGTDLSKQILRY